MRDRSTGRPPLFLKDKTVSNVARSDPETPLEAIRQRLDAACAEAGRPDRPAIIAVSKTQPIENIEPLLAAGHREFGENRVQEAQAKWPALKARFSDVRLRLIGPLQSNKAADAVALFDAIDSIDREKIARAVAREMAAQGRRPEVLVQINTGEEPQKAGIAPADADAFILWCKDELGLPVRGVMCIPPVDEAPAPHFALLERIARRNALPVVSMGMSGDYEIAAVLGATHVRIGTALFGRRPS